MAFKFLRILAAAAALSVLGGCFVTDLVEDVQGDIFEKTKFEDDTGYTELSAVKLVDCEYYAPVSGGITHGRDALYTESQKECYDLIGKSVYKISETKNSDGFYPVGKVTVEDKTFTDKDMDICIKAYTMDHPEVFWITNRYTYGTAGNQAVIQLYSYVGGEKCRELIDSFTDSVNTLLSGIPSGLKQYHLEKYVHNTLLDGCVYNTAVNTAEDGWEEFTAYGAITGGSAVCEGYAHAMCLLLNKVGIDCYYVNGYGENSAHMWNTVKINDNWYHLDATWDDNENAYFNYFNLSDERIKWDHIIEPTLSQLKDSDKLPSIYNLFLPECTSDSANFFVVESTFIDDYEDCRDVMVGDLINAARNGDEMFTIRFDDSIDFDDAMKYMFNDEPYYMFDYISEANDSLDDAHKIKNDNLAIIMINNFNAVVVRLEYS